MERERERMIGVGQSKYRKDCPFFPFSAVLNTQEISYVQEKMGESVLVRWMNLEPIQSEVS